ncbi:Crp/Fnr family transcriptional regulator [Pararcticibacter amylolyticus]|uniref:Cyclic nucleotide-binding domain-containing protein n=1 Tax=Pararcticibacter amylolyticus TaxID=2173175 RepID=A0A2U2PIG2_9SPHI|nr:Crp/Fnr family transcriptional regulator [Pararcticibacter amylolyticus]PWG81197.1 hypothetical protein DDR33_07360 [Pararcticibacter amylolyticus]
MDINLLVKTLSLYGDPEPEAIHYLTRTMKEQVLKPNKKLLEQGAINRRLYFLTKGLVSEYRNTSEGERTTGFAGRGDFFTHSESFTTQQASPVSICSETDSIVLSLDHSEYRDLITGYPAVKKIFQALYHHYNERRNRINISLLDDPVEARIQTLKEEYPDILQFARTKHLISFLRTNYKRFHKAMTMI